VDLDGEVRQHSSGVVISPVAPADPVVTGGRIWTQDPAWPWAEALAATNGLIAAVGDAAKVSALVAPVPRNS
jgi:predicted amidohydrolase YtcJ